MQRLLLLFIILCAATETIIAQDDDMPDNLYSAWTVTDLLAEDGDEPIENLVAFLHIDEETILEVWTGADVIYTLQDDGTYSGANLLPVGYDFSATLTIIDEDTYETFSEISSGTFTTETNLLYERTEIEIGVWIEPERDLQEFSLFGDCMGRVDVSPPLAFSQPDPILTILIDEDAGELVLGENVLTGSGTYELEEEDTFGQFARVTTQTAVVSEDAIDFSFYSIADSRDDCELIYETQFLPFDGDYEDFFDLVEEISEPEEE